MSTRHTLLPDKEGGLLLILPDIGDRIYIQKATADGTLPWGEAGRYLEPGDFDYISEAVMLPDTTIVFISSKSDESINLFRINTNAESMYNNLYINIDRSMFISGTHNKSIFYSNSNETNFFIFYNYNYFPLLRRYDIRCQYIDSNGRNIWPEDTVMLSPNEGDSVNLQLFKATIVDDNSIYILTKGNWLGEYPKWKYLYKLNSNGIFSGRNYNYISDNELNINNDFNIINIYPVPSNSGINIRIFNKRYKNIKISIYNLSGQSVFTDTLSLLRGDNIIQWNPEDNMSSGIYFIELINNDNVLGFKKIVLLR